MRASRAADLRRFEGEDYATLLTCTPYGVNSHRLLVRGMRIEYRPEVRETVVLVGDTATDALVRLAASITAGAMGTMVLFVAIVRRRREAAIPARRGAP